MLDRRPSQIENRSEGEMSRVVAISASERSEWSNGSRCHLCGAAKIGQRELTESCQARMEIRMPLTISSGERYRRAEAKSLVAIPVMLTRSVGLLGKEWQV